MKFLFLLGIMTMAVCERLLRAVRNYDARLPCGQGKIFLDGPDAYVLWVKDDERFVYRFPNEDTLAKSLNPNNIYGTSCIDTDHCYDDTSLFLPKVGDKDAGIYRCRVHYQGSSSVDYVINLQIVEATGTPKILDEKGEQIVTNYVGPLTMGSNLTIMCEVVISEPPTTVLWLRNGETIRRIVSDKPGILREKVEIINATRSELDARYQCTASNADVTEAMAASVVIKMYLPPLKVEIRLNDNLNFEVGHPRVVDCVVVGCFPTPTINWYLGGSLLKASAHKELHDGNYTVSSLTLTASMRDNKKWLSCRVHNAYLPTIYEDNVTLHVSYRPTCNIEEARVIGIVPGETEEITCTMISPEPPHHFRWLFSNGRVIITYPMALRSLRNTYTTVLSWVPGVVDVGRLECYIVTVRGELRDPCLFNLVQGWAAQPPICFQQEMTQAENIRLACEAADGIPQSSWQRVIVSSAMSGVAVASAAAGIYMLLNRRRNSTRNCQEGLFHREPDFAREDRTQGSILECHQSSCQNMPHHFQSCPQAPVATPLAPVATPLAPAPLVRTAKGITTLMNQKMLNFPRVDSESLTYYV